MSGQKGQAIADHVGRLALWNRLVAPVDNIDQGVDVSRFDGWKVGVPPNRHERYVLTTTELGLDEPAPVTYDGASAIAQIHRPGADRELVRCPPPPPPGGLRVTGGGYGSHGGAAPSAGRGIRASKVRLRADKESRRQMTDEAVREILTADQAADLLQVSLRTVLQLAREGELRGHKVGRAWRFCRSDVLAYVQGVRLVGQG